MKVIQPLSNDIKPPDDPVVPRQAPPAAVPAARTPNPAAVQSAHKPARFADESPRYDDQDTRWTYAPYLFVFGAVAGAFYSQLYTFVASHLPPAASVCMQAGAITTTCSNRLLAGIIAATVLFLVASGIHSLMVRKSFCSPFL